MYGCGTFQNLPRSLWNQLQNIERTSLKTALRLPKFAVNVPVYQKVGWLSYREERLLASTCFEARVQATNNNAKEILAEVLYAEEIQSPTGDTALDPPDLYSRHKPQQSLGTITY